MIFPNGDKYEGEWIDGKQNGQGTKNYPDGRIMYVGYWKDGNYYGQGTKTLADGEKYVGEWQDGERWNGTEYDKDGLAP